MAADTHRILLEFTCDDGAAETVERSIGQEIGEIDDDRSTTRLDRDGDVVRIEIEAADHVALRAAINTWCSLVEVAESVNAAAATRMESGDF